MATSRIRGMSDNLLARYLARTGTKPGKLARIIGVNRSTLYRWTQKTIPDRTSAKALELATNGRIPHDTWYRVEKRRKAKP